LIRKIIQIAVLFISVGYFLCGCSNEVVEPKLSVQIRGIKDIYFEGQPNIKIYNKKATLIEEWYPKGQVPTGTIYDTTNYEMAIFFDIVSSGGKPAIFHELKVDWYWQDQVRGTASHFFSEDGKIYCIYTPIGGKPLMPEISKRSFVIPCRGKMAFRLETIGNFNWPGETMRILKFTMADEKGNTVFGPFSITLTTQPHASH
jgi:hypothetical protein